MITPSVQQFRRSYRLDVGDKRIESISGSNALRIAFEVCRKTLPEPNAAKVRIWNLSPTSRGEIEERGAVSVRLEVGYQSFLQQIFFGALRKVDTVKDGTDWITECTSGDGEDKISGARLYKSFAKSTPVLSVLETLVQALGIGTGNMTAVASKLAGQTLTHGFGVSGTVAEGLTEFTRSYGLVWSIQDGNFTLQEINQAIPGTEGPLITPATGLIGTPKVDSKGVVSGKAFILPALIPGVPFRVESSRVTADCVAIGTIHEGDSAGQNWFVQFRGKGIGKKLK